MGTLPTSNTIIDDRLLVALLVGEAVAVPDEGVWTTLVPTMVAVSGRHPRLNLMNVEAAAAAVLLEATVLLSEPAARGVLPEILSAEQVPWRAIRPRRRRGAR